MIFFFFKQKSAYDMRISDWSSDVCSSDLMACSARGLQRSIQREIALGQIVKTRDGTGRLSTLSGEGKGSDSAIGWPPTHPGGRIETLRRREGRERGLPGETPLAGRSEEHTSELQSLMRISYAVFCLKKKKIMQMQN